MKSGLRNWKTTTAAIAALISNIGLQVQHSLDSDPQTVADWSATIPLAIIAIGLMFGRDADKSTEESKGG